MSEKPILIKEIEIGGRCLKLETGRVAGQAGGAVLVRYGDTVVLVTATMSKTVREGIDFFPLTVDYEERLYAVGKIPGGFIKREGRPSEKAILSGRLIDRPIRPLFPKGCRNEVQVVATILSVDQDNAPEIAAMIGASAALHISEIPFQGPIGGVIVGLVDGEYVINPTLAQAEKSLMHLVVAGTRDAVMMVEAGAKEVPEDQILGGITFGHEKVKEIVEFIENFREEALALGLAKEKITPVLAQVDPQVEEAVSGPAAEELTAAVRQCIERRLDKQAREAFLDEVKAKLVESFRETFPEQEQSILAVIEAVEKKIVRRFILEEGVRIDGRALDEIRPISVEAGILPRTHGSGLFTRGQTQVLSVVTLGAISDEQILDDLGIEEAKRFMHHYNFPPYSTGETRPMRSPGRREIGHGALAERALEPVIPGEDTFPYTIRLVSEVLSSNGSTSMGSVCGSCVALMDAGIPIKAPVAGVAMGLVKEEDRVAILTDIQGIEDHLGDMDFKVAGTARGITALQMDIKIPGISADILEKALAQAREGRLYILNKILEVIPAPRPELSPYAPRIIHTVIDPDKIREVIGPGGKVIKKIIDETGVEIDIEDDGRVYIAAVDPAAAKRALEIIENITKDVVVGEIYTGKVTRVTDFGAFVEVVPGVFGMPGKEGLVHISHLAHHRVNRVEDVVKEGDTIVVKAIGFDNQGRLKLSRKEALPPEPREAAPHHRRPKGRQGRH
ncbi:polyribonucleotide nucleotidyltransferase [Desulfofundulus sp. TPOSR]|jgi:polyribonucleotide nucleotidyltransferase|uniref:Polyribonucleotide nucleotidyltransferase n=1 Tax=Desulfofundulus kuznetsovii (strain DSM 6115 / VKM B-1805 / 17) TaxID=760568 RepID=A0AAU8PRL9_DESK7|nr:polyribonucleotide nucleotidyltransferase [Desulfofundulus sp. TPOSR]AEG16060.1 Polyribonucleotide nucleotidyltransferase [Desulfofundulus kuznetsovii DSM 6115]NHM27438.1 polyribonucleotide nucleotidyltransferase [Desulfofundulus sp. TPOSR]